MDLFQAREGLPETSIQKSSFLGKSEIDHIWRQTVHRGRLRKNHGLFTQDLNLYQSWNYSCYVPITVDLLSLSMIIKMYISASHRLN